MSDIPQIYDPQIDAFRPVTQTDVDLMQAYCAAWGAVAEEVKKQVPDLVGAREKARLERQSEKTAR